VFIVSTLIVKFLVAGKRRQTKTTAEKNDTSNIPEQDHLSRNDSRVVSGIPVSGWNCEVITYSFFFFLTHDGLSTLEFYVLTFIHNVSS
jgi:hypothetical protein